MKKTQIGIFFGIGIIIIIFSFLTFSDPKEKENKVFHVTLADPNLYKDGIFSDTFRLKKGEYLIQFIPNGDSPKTLSIVFEGTSFSFSEDFILEGTPHDTGISVYYTWEYLGTKKIIVPEEQDVEIRINPHNNILGPVSVDLILK